MKLAESLVAPRVPSVTTDNPASLPAASVPKLDESDIKVVSETRLAVKKPRGPSPVPCALAAPSLVEAGTTMPPPASTPLPCASADVMVSRPLGPMLALPPQDNPSGCVVVPTEEPSLSTEPGEGATTEHSKRKRRTSVTDARPWCDNPAMGPQQVADVCTGKFTNKEPLLKWFRSRVDTLQRAQAAKKAASVSSTGRGRGAPQHAQPFLASTAFAAGNVAAAVAQPPPKKVVVLCGPPGCGKRALARALCMEFDVERVEPEMVTPASLYATVDVDMGHRRLADVGKPFRVRAWIVCGVDKLYTATQLWAAAESSRRSEEWEDARGTGSHTTGQRSLASRGVPENGASSSGGRTFGTGSAWSQVAGGNTSSSRTLVGGNEDFVPHRRTMAGLLHRITTASVQSFPPLIMTVHDFQGPEMWALKEHPAVLVVHVCPPLLSEASRGINNLSFRMGIPQAVTNDALRGFDGNLKNVVTNLERWWRTETARGTLLVPAKLPDGSTVDPTRAATAHRGGGGRLQHTKATPWSAATNLFALNIPPASATRIMEVLHDFGGGKGGLETALVTCSYGGFAGVDPAMETGALAALCRSMEAWSVSQSLLGHGLWKWAPVCGGVWWAVVVECRGSRSECRLGSATFAERQELIGRAKLPLVSGRRGQASSSSSSFSPRGAATSGKPNTKAKNKTGRSGPQPHLQQHPQGFSEPGVALDEAEPGAGGEDTFPLVRLKTKWQDIACDAWGGTPTLCVFLAEGTARMEWAETFCLVRSHASAKSARAPLAANAPLPTSAGLTVVCEDRTAAVATSKQPSAPLPHRPHIPWSERSGRNFVPPPPMMLADDYANGASKTGKMVASQRPVGPPVRASPWDFVGAARAETRRDFSHAATQCTDVPFAACAYPTLCVEASSADPCASVAPVTHQVIAHRTGLTPESTLLFRTFGRTCSKFTSHEALCAALLKPLPSLSLRVLLQE